MRSLLLIFSIGASLLLSGWVSAQTATGSQVIYRYKNTDGITVLDSKIPPEYVNGGYQIISRTGKVLKVVEPAVQGAEGERLYRERLEREARERDDVQLRRSYSNVADIESAKTRNLESLRGNISILQANLTSAKSRLQTYQSQAAAIERTGRPLPDDLSKNINNLVQEEKDIHVQIQQREQEYKTVEQKFDNDRKRFIEITQ
jgi:chromosome segregation ATPase